MIKLKMQKSQYFLGLLLSISICSFGQKGVKYIPINETEVTGIIGKKATGKLEIPESVILKGKEYKVTCFGNPNYQKWINSDVKELVLPNSVTKIFQLRAFGLEQVHLPNAVTYIGRKAFGFSNVKEIVLPNSVKHIGAEAFYMSKLEKIQLPDSLKRIDEMAFCATNLTEVVIPNSVDTILAGAFFLCEQLESIKVPDRIVYSNKTSRGEDLSVFYRCDNLIRIQGYDRLLPEWVEYDLSNMGKENDNITNKEYGIPPVKSQIQRIKNKSFYWYLREHVIPSYREWKEKKPFETIAQYEQRTNSNNLNLKKTEMYKVGRAEFVKVNKPSSIDCKLLNYYVDFGIYEIEVKGAGSVFVVVPVEEKDSFEDNFDTSKITCSFDIIKDVVGITDFECEINGKIYQATHVNADAEPQFIVSGQNNYVIAEDTPNVYPLETDKSVDYDIPVSFTNNTNTFVVVIGNEKYQKVAEVSFANKDATVFAEYCHKTLGVPTNNVRQYSNATFGILLSAIKDIKNIAKVFNSDLNVIFYYAGHGVPNEVNKDAFLLPVDADGQQTEVCYSVSRLYKELGEIGAKNVVVFIDACFSGSKRGDGMLASARGVAIKAKPQAPQGNMVVFSAATGDETAFPYNEKGHGMFTYFLLKKLQESKGDCTLGELGEYIQTNVRQRSVVVNRKTQTPTIVPSETMDDSWKNLKLR